MSSGHSATPLFGFSDSDNWERRGNRIVRRARDTSYKEKVLSGIPIEYFLNVPASEEITCASPRRRVRPEFMEPEPRMLYRGSSRRPDDSKLVPSESNHDDHWSEESHELFKIITMFDDPIVVRNHRGHFRSSRKKRIPKFEPKAQKIPARLNRGKDRYSTESCYESRNEMEWLDMCDRVIDSTIWWEMRKPCSYQPKYSYRDYDSIICRFKAKLEFSIHSTSEHIINAWNKYKKEIQADYTPLPNYEPNFRYFDRTSDVEYDEWEWDWIDHHPVRLYF